MLDLGFHYSDAIWSKIRIKSGPVPNITENFLDVLNLARGLNCTDTRDRVYAFLGHPAAFKQTLLDGTPYMW